MYFRYFFCDRQFHCFLLVPTFLRPDTQQLFELLEINTAAVYELHAKY